MSSNQSLTLEILKKFPNKNWNWGSYRLTTPRGISSNKNITIEWIKTFPYKPWDWKIISSNPNIRKKFIEKYIDKIDFMELSKNRFTFYRQIYDKVKLFYYLSFSKIILLQILCKNYGLYK